MKLPLFWLKNYIAITETADALAHKLTMSGSKVEAVEKSGGEAVIEIEVTTNRPDCLSILGLAKEISALSGKKVTAPKLSAETKQKTEIKIHVADKKACPLYTARVIKNVEIKPAPPEARKCLELMGSRPINNAVDATNYVLFEAGQPLHAFDLDKISGDTIFVRFAKKDEKFLGLDGKEHVLDDKTLVIADASGAIAIAGVIGGKKTEVTDSTKNILLEAAYFDPALVRQASKKLKITTDSSYRFERGVVPEDAARNSRRALDLIKNWGGGSEEGFSASQSLKPAPLKKINVSIERAQKLLGLAVAPGRIKKILEALGFTSVLKGKSILVVPPPSRKDIAIEEDVMEEIIRVEGFEKVPSALPLSHHKIENISDKRAEAVSGLKKFLAAQGLSEIMTYSLISQKMMEDAGVGIEEASRVVNPLSADTGFFRPSLLPGMLSALSFNVNRKAPAFHVFEIGNCCMDNEEAKRLGIILYGKWREDWRLKEEAGFYHLKGIVENMLAHWKIADYEWQGGRLLVGGKGAGCVKVLPSSVQKKADAPLEIVYAEIDLGDWIWEERHKKSVKVKPVPKYPWVRRDIAFVIDTQVPVKDLETAMREAAAPHLKEASLFDEFKGKNIPQGKRSLAFSLAYYKETGTFTDEEIQSLQGRVAEALKQKFRVDFRS